MIEEACDEGPPFLAPFFRGPFFSRSPFPQQSTVLLFLLRALTANDTGGRLFDLGVPGREGDLDQPRAVSSKALPWWVSSGAGIVKMPLGKNTF